MPYYVYFVRSPQGQLYVGQAKNLSQRLKSHLKKKGAKYARDYRTYDLVYSEEFSTRVDAMKRERQLKRWRRAKKEALIAGDLEQLRKL